jgi:uncharacterized protein HemX
MTVWGRITEETEQPAEGEVLDPVLQQTLRDFRASVHAWSGAVCQSPRNVHEVVVHRTWRLAAGWALALVLLGGAASGGLYERHHQQELARMAAAQAAQQQRELAAQHAREEEDLLAKVDSDVAREVPSAMEPLASLMTDDVTK